MIRNSIKLLFLSLAIGISTTGCSSDDSSPVKPPIIPPIIKPEVALVFDYNTTVIAEQKNFKEGTATDIGTAQIAKEWTPSMEYLKPAKLTLDKEKLVVTYNENKVQEYTVKIENNNIIIQATDKHPAYTFAKMSDDKKSLSIHSSFFRIKGTHKTLNVNNVASLQEYGAVDFNTFTNKYNHLKNTSGKYLKVEFKYTQKN